VKFSDLNPCFVDVGGEGITDKDGNPIPERTGIGVTFDCPCGCTVRGYVGFENPIDGGPPRASKGEPLWHRDGDTFDTLTLRPSILRSKSKGACGWHGFITGGLVNGC
jgi:hypothetical protein